MNNIIKTILVALTLITLNACSSVNNTPTAKNVNLKRYMGKWYEIARFETSFQRGKFDSQADYVLLDDGTVSITNSAIDKYGNRTKATAKGYAPDPNNPSKLRISFFRPFYADYLILALDPNYQWALVGGSGKDYLWILSRTPTLPKDTINQIIATAEKLKFDTSKLMFNSKLKEVALAN